MNDIHTNRLLLRLPNEGDAPAFLELHRDPAVMIAAAPPGSNDVTVAWRNIAMMIGHWQLRGYGQWTVVEKSSGEVVGRVGLYHPDGWPGIELGWIIHPAKRGRGFASEAALAALNWTWRTSSVDHVISMIAPDNLQSVRIAHKIGQRFEREDTLGADAVHVYGVRRELHQRLE